MIEGLLWFDDDPTRSLKEKVMRAAKRYQEKHGQRANLCYVHPAMIENGKTEFKVGAVHVLPRHTVLPNHFWIGKQGGEQ